MVIKQYKKAVLVCLVLFILTGCLRTTGEKKAEEVRHGPFIRKRQAEFTIPLPSVYDSRKEGRAPKVEDQQDLGTCWAFASLTALESALLPEESWDFSEDHMSIRNSFHMGQNAGGDYTMSLAYLLAWQGPVTEEEDPYNDGISPEGLTAEKHLQEVQILPAGDREAIKQAVYRTGGVQSSLYTSLKNSQSQSAYYQKENRAYYYDGDAEPNHDVVIMGWDDEYPRENFTIPPPEDGAFLCVSSWGEAFGDGGYFYVSYYDSNMGQTNLVYTKIEDKDNYDKIYQTDLCGWSGQAGYGSDTAYGANVYQAEEREQLAAAGFYAVGPDTRYEIYGAAGIDKIPASGVQNGSVQARTLDFKDRQLLAQGTLKYAGYYTIDFERPLEIEKGQRFAVIIKLTTRDSVQPIAIEYQADSSPGTVDITDGEGYLSYDGIHFQRAETAMKCNICLKAYTRRIP